MYQNKVYLHTYMCMHTYAYLYNRLYLYISVKNTLLHFKKVISVTVMKWDLPH